MSRYVYSQSDRTPRGSQPHGGRVLLERQGYVSAKDRIEAILLAGKRLVSQRGFQYDFQPGEDVDEDFIDPTRSKSYDMVDAFRDGIALEERFKEVQRVQREAKEKESNSKASQSSPERSGEVLNDEVVKKDTGGR